MRSLGIMNLLQRLVFVYFLFFRLHWECYKCALNDFVDESFNSIYSTLRIFSVSINVCLSQGGLLGREE